MENDCISSDDSTFEPTESSNSTDSLIDTSFAEVESIADTDDPQSHHLKACQPLNFYGQQNTLMKNSTDFNNSSGTLNQCLLNGISDQAIADHPFLQNSISNPAIFEGKCGFVDSDDDNEAPRTKWTSLAKKYTERAFKMITDWNSDASIGQRAPPNPADNAWIVRLAKFDEKWASCGPVMLHFTLDEPQRLVGHYLYGTRSVALNMVLFEELNISRTGQRFFIPNSIRKSITLSTMGRNTIINSEIHLTPIEIEPRVFITKCTHLPTPVAEPSATNIHFKFNCSQSFDSFAHKFLLYIQKLVEKNILARCNTFISPQPVYSNTGTRTSKFGQCDFSNEEIFIKQVLSYTYSLACNQWSRVLSDICNG